MATAELSLSDGRGGLGRDLLIRCRVAPVGTGRNTSFRLIGFTGFRPIPVRLTPSTPLFIAVIPRKLRSSASTSTWDDPVGRWRLTTLGSVQTAGNRRPGPPDSDVEAVAVMQPYDRSSKWLIDHYAAAMLRLAGITDVISCRPVPGEVVQPRQLPDGLLEV